MRIAIVSNDNESSKDVQARLLSACKQADFSIDQDHPGIVVSIGGDGTLLEAFHHYEKQLDHVRFVGVHTGHLGFYTDWTVDELDQFIDFLLNDSGESVSYPLLEVALEKVDGEKNHLIALNEATLRRFEGTMTGEVFIKEEKFELFKGDGLCVSTPTGSTGLNKSLGGAVVHPRLDTLQVTEIASLNNRVYRTISSPILIAGDEWIRVKLDDEFLAGVFMTLDHLSFSLKGVKNIEFRIAKSRVHFARYRHMHFWDRVENAFIGLGDRDKKG
ncbi:NAD kinase [Aerococcus sp. JJEM-2022b]|uniref:NAD kinase n=1 Tax=Aerococcus mictus TaxID=2976810 RepID=UPI00227CB056|nr:NAD kinase [Aerococcus mictus]MCY3078484.1 NAD kinase [Aerococcus mictus]